MKLISFDEFVQKFYLRFTLFSVPSKVTGPMENPSVVMQQMAQLAAATPMSHYIPIVNPSQAMTAPPPFPNALGGFLPEKIPYPGN